MTSPQAENTAPQKCEADFRSDVAYSVGEAYSVVDVAYSVAMENIYIILC